MTIGTTYVWSLCAQNDSRTSDYKVSRFFDYSIIILQIHTYIVSLLIKNITQDYFFYNYSNSTFMLRKPGWLCAV